MPKVDLPSLVMVITFSVNLFIGMYSRNTLSVPKGIGEAILVLGFVACGYVLLYLRKGFFGDTEPNLDHLVTEGPYRFCRHPLYLSFILIVLGIDLMLGSLIASAFTLLLSVPSAIYRARVEDELLKRKFGKQWENYAEEVGFLLPKIFG